MRGGEITKSKIKKSKKGILGILGAKRKAKYTKKSGVTVSQVKGKVDPKKVVKKALTLGAIGASGALWKTGTMAGLELGTKAFGSTTAASAYLSAGTALAGSTLSLAPLASSTQTAIGWDTATMRTSVKGKVSKGNVVKSEWGKMGA